jgi:hypothetical protein
MRAASNSREDLLPLMPQVNAALAMIQPGTLQVVGNVP